MLYRSLFPHDVLAELDRLQRGVQGLFDPAPGIRGLARDSFPALNIGRSAEAVEVQAFVPGIDPASLDVQIDRGVLTLSGERKPLPAADERATRHLDERPSGRFRRVVSLPEDIDPDAVSARCADGVLQIRIARRAAPQPRRITVQ
ncbi:MAG: hypothetical protein RIQ53_188 [Pseudomonadota bacterium]|jgi:HSP20 family protein